jgi:hypothetical protein
MNNLGLDARTLRGLLWYERRKNGPFLSWIVALLFEGGLVLCLFNHPALIIAFGGLYGAIAGLRFGGMETAEGSSEFVYALPPTRQQRCVVSLAIGLISVITISLLGDLALTFNLPQAFWRIFVSSGFTEPYEQVSAKLHWLVVLAPTAVFSGSFAMASFAKSGARAMAAPFVGIVMVTVISKFSLNAGAVIPALFLFTVLALTMGYRFYLTKEQISRTKQLQGSWLVLVIVCVAIIFLLLNLNNWGSFR